MPSPPFQPGGWNPQLPPQHMASPPFNEIIEVDYSEECLQKFDTRGQQEVPGKTVDELTARKLSEVMARYRAFLSMPQYNDLEKFLDCVINSIYRLTFRKPLPATCASVKAAIEYVCYDRGGGHMRDTIRMKFDDPMGFQDDERVRHAGQQQLSLLWSLVVRRAEQKYQVYGAHILPTNIALDVGLNSPFAAIAILESEYLGKFNLRDCMNSLGGSPIKLEGPSHGSHTGSSVIELGDFHPNAQ